MLPDRLPQRIRICEMGPRDGLQNIPDTVPLEVKLGLIERLQAAGLSYIEVAAFVSPRAVPQMADAQAVCAGLKRRPGVSYAALAPNVRGLERALACGIDELGLFTAASETFSQHNTRCTIDESLERAAAIAAPARAASVRLRGYVSCVLGCPYEGATDPGKVAELAAALFELGCYEVSLGDTIGVGTPGKARALLARVRQAVPTAPLALHFHDTYGQALANILACLELDIASVDSSVAGLGGCPYAPGASGNVASEDVVYMLHGLGIETGVDLDALCAAGAYISEALGRPSGSKAGRALAARARRG
ncbi:MAG: hydroxymethylglutaryl-CoA lyase [Immundisolibacter sp.]|uniref:hydroxymethylglutaryl-CoA lyase n=1 Tax=Immundisolibacter sp. TaxID=1934948 RepID=UPI0019CDDCC6|nr:hydroxymethylglutaryl-CoA lyase [Immundisolibacter sp.]MBC7161389.1 hydroxymethylglutaryl-CoA lyase [Immundisolibacter sp.]